jgi:hypothetical protein
MAVKIRRHEQGHQGEKGVGCAEDQGGKFPVPAGHDPGKDRQAEGLVDQKPPEEGPGTAFFFSALRVHTKNLRI